MAKKKVAAKAAAFQEKETFEADTAETPADKNQKLADLLDGPWIDFAIVHIDRIEIGTQKGWRALYRA